MFPGRCPGLICGAPSGQEQESRNIKKRERGQVGGFRERIFGRTPRLRSGLVSAQHRLELDATASYGSSYSFAATQGSDVTLTTCDRRFHHLIDPGRPVVTRRRIDWSNLYGNGNPVELEIGSGKGLFLSTPATSHPGVNYLGIELSRKYALYSAQRLARRELPNAKVWCGDARTVLARLVPGGELEGRARVLSRPLVEDPAQETAGLHGRLVRRIERTLQVRGELAVASDVLEYFGVIRGLIAASGRFLEQELSRPAEPRTRSITSRISSGNTGWKGGRFTRRGLRCNRDGEHAPGLLLARSSDWVDSYARWWPFPPETPAGLPFSSW